MRELINLKTIDHLLFWPMKNLVLRGKYHINRATSDSKYIKSGDLFIVADQHHCYVITESGVQNPITFDDLNCSYDPLDVIDI